VPAPPPPRGRGPRRRRGRPRRDYVGRELGDRDRARRIERRREPEVRGRLVDATAVQPDRPEPERQLGDELAAAVEIEHLGGGEPRLRQPRLCELRLDLVIRAPPLVAEPAGAREHGQPIPRDGAGGAAAGGDRRGVDHRRGAGAAGRGGDGVRSGRGGHGRIDRGARDDADAALGRGRRRRGRRCGLGGHGDGARRDRGGDRGDRQRHGRDRAARSRRHGGRITRLGDGGRTARARCMVPTMSFEWWNKSNGSGALAPAERAARREAMYRAEALQRASLMRRLGYSAAECRRRLRAYAAWEFDGSPHAPTDADVDRAVTAVYGDGG
jgi:hypothetical protein